MTDFAALLAVLGQHEVAYIMVGGAAAIAHGSVRLTQDLDIVYERSPANLDRLVAALAEHQPYLRGAPAGLPFVWDRDTLVRGLNFTDLPGRAWSTASPSAYIISALSATSALSQILTFLSLGGSASRR